MVEPKRNNNIFSELYNPLETESEGSSERGILDSSHNYDKEDRRGFIRKVYGILSV
jgi:hypothetical protein